MKPHFSLIHATARPDKWQAAHDSWYNRCDHPEQVEYALCIDRAQAAEIFLPAIHRQHVWGLYRCELNHGRRAAVTAWNLAAESSIGEVIIAIADDYFPSPHWDTDLLHIIQSRSIHANPEFVLDVDNQEGSTRLLVFPFVSRAYYNRLGCLLWPEYHGLGADNDFTERARMDDVVVDARGVKFAHPQFPVDDPVYQWQHRPEAAWQEIFDRRQAEGFPYGEDALARLNGGVAA
jgi:hypothetical protein